jgi:hypothetical protein
MGCPKGQDHDSRDQDAQEWNQQAQENGHI